MHTTYIKHLSDRRSRQRRDGQHRSYTDANLVKLGTLRRADRTIPIDFFLGAEGFTGAHRRPLAGSQVRSCRRTDGAVGVNALLGAEGFAGAHHRDRSLAGSEIRSCRRTDGAVGVDVLRGAEGFADTFRFPGIADFTDIGAGGARRGRGIAAACVVLVLAAQGLRDAAALLTALVGAGIRRLFLTLCREGAVGIALLRVGMDALGHGSVALLRMGMGAGDFRRPFGVAAACVVLGVVLAQPALLGKDRGGNHGHQQTRGGKDR